MTDILSLDEGYSTTRLLTKEKPEIINTPEDKFETVLFLPEGENRKGEGGLRTKGYFKRSFDDKPLISIITVVFNGEKYLEDTIQSVINQTYGNVEYIIIDGGSTDGTLDIIKKYENQIDYWVSEKDRGIYDAMNKGIEVSLGEIIGIVNSDDYLYLDTISNIANLYLENKFNYTYGTLDYIDENGNKLYEISSIGLNNIKYKIFKHMPYLHPTMFVSKKLYKKIGVYNIRYKLSADYDFVLRFIENKYKGVELSFKTGCFRVGGVSGGIETIKENHNLLLEHKESFFLVWLNTFILKVKLKIRNLKK
ncbi:glycosyltransferase family 2 protein [Aliarcobacter cryaerophilus]|uniref:glycosyltransferase family 2 protein n=1 Tax=Aliarcobacter cryaerophilus TaxID=28198 RepID=UPI0021B3AFBE|nr:glycosyltransferase family 2 protein [Aliarcobacter cryaerophilus]MCT7515044.1 glycosyltransferase [Aliarcobacter cryaerophilus]